MVTWTASVVAVVLAFTSCNVTAAIDLSALEHGIELYVFRNDLPTPIACSQCSEFLNVFKNDTDGAMSSIISQVKNKKPPGCGRNWEECSMKLRAVQPHLKEIMRLQKRSHADVCNIVSDGICGSIKRETQLPLPPPPAQVKSAPKPQRALRVLHVTDPHATNAYRPGRLNICLSESCCTVREDETSDPSRASGPWGDDRGNHHCNGPYRTFESAIKDAAKREFDIVLFGGDVMPHSPYNHSVSEALEALQKHTDILKRHLKNKPVFPILGNHDVIPTHQVPPPDLDSPHSREMGKYYESVWNMWKSWLPSSAEASFKHSGSYVAPVVPGLKIVALNTLYAYKGNRWSELDSEDPAGQLRWLIEQLENLEKNGEKAYIHAHISPNSPDCHRNFGKSFSRIIGRFKNTVLNQFYGHEHWDYFLVNNCSRDGGASADQPTGVQFYGPSITTFVTGSPSYRIYSTTSDSFRVDDHTTYFLNLTKVNTAYYESLSKDKAFDMESLGEVTWDTSYNFKTEFGVDSTSPEELCRLSRRLMTDDQAMKRFYQLYYQRQPELSDLKTIWCVRGVCNSNNIGSRLIERFRRY